MVDTFDNQCDALFRPDAHNLSECQPYSVRYNEKGKVFLGCNRSQNISISVLGSKSDFVRWSSRLYFVVLNEC